MSDVPLCSIAVAEQLAAADLEELEMALPADSCKLQQPTTRLFGVDDTFVLLVAGVVSGLPLDLRTASDEEILEWFQR